MSTPSTYETRARRRRRARRRAPMWAVIVVVVGALLAIGAGIASAAIALHGRGVLNAEVYSGRGLQVSDVRLSTPLTPGGAADLLFSVRNPNAYPVRVEQVSLVGALGRAKPEGCIAKVTGPVTRAAGFSLPSAERVLVGAGARGDVVVRAAFALAATAKSGCGFTVEVDVSATQLAPATSPATVKPSTAPTSAPTPMPPKGAPWSSSTPAAPPTTTTAPPPAGEVDCDTAVDPDCPVVGK
jgi:hypothetical protein